MTLIDYLKTLCYPGRFIVIGQDGASSAVIYGATGRSPSSLARRFVHRGSDVCMVAVNDTVRKEGNRELLEYPAVKIFENGIVVANGRHIENLHTLESRSAASQLSEALLGETYEPDEYKTPRITGCMIERKEGTEAALHIVRALTETNEVRAVWPVSLVDGQGLYIATYTGEDVKPAPSFQGQPVSISLNFNSADSAAHGVFNALTPQGGERDYRVGVVAVYKKEEKYDFAIKNLLPDL